MSELHSHDHEHMHDHDHDHEHDHEYLHAHGIPHSHAHVHENQKAVINRLSRAIGHLEKVKRMVEEGYDCSEVLVQLAAVRSAQGTSAVQPRNIGAQTLCLRNCRGFCFFSLQ